jgi:hypothetical protein
MKTYIITLFAGEEECCNEQVEIECDNLELEGVFSVLIDNKSRITFERGIEHIGIKS